MTSIPSAFSFPIRAPPSSHSSDEEGEGRAVEKKKGSYRSSSGSDSEAFHSGSEEEFETASERPFVGDPDEEILEVAPTGPGGAVLGIGASVGSLPPRKAMPIARVSGGDDGGEDDGKGFGDGGFAGGVEGDDGASGVARVPLGEGGQGDFGGSGKQEAFAGGDLEGGVLVGEREIVSAEKENYGGGDSAVTAEVLDSVPSETPAVEPAAVDDLVSGIGSNASNPADGQSVVEGQENLEAAKADYAVVGTNSTQKPLGAITVSSVTAPQSTLQSEVASTDEAGSGSDQGNHAIVKELASSDAVGVVESVGIEDSNESQFQSTAPSNSQDKSGLADPQPDSTDVVHATGEFTDSNGVEAETGIVEKKEVVIPAVVETPQSGSHVKEGLDKSEPPSTDSVAIPEVGGDGFNQVEVEGVGKEELANSVSVGNKTVVTENKDAVGDDGASDKDPELVITESNEASSAAEGTTASKPVETEKNESGLGSANLGVEPSELEPAAVEERHENRYETQTALSDNSKAIESVIDREAKAAVAEDSESVEMAEDIPKSSGGTPIVDASVNAHEDAPESGISGEEREISVEDLLSGSVSAESEVKQETLDFGAEGDDEEEEDMGDSGTVERIIREIEKGSSSSQLERSGDHSKNTVDGQIIMESDEDVETDEEGDGKELFDSAALAALLKAASNAASDGTVTVNASDAARFFQVERPAGLGSSAPSLKPAPPRSNRLNIFAPSDLAVVGEPESNMDEEEKKLHEKIQQIRVKFLRLVQRLGHAPEDTVAQQVLYRLDLAEGLRRGRQTNRSSRESAKKMAMQLEESGTDDLNFSCNILILGKTGVGKSATINSIFGQEKTPMSAFKPATSGVKEIFGIVDGVKIRVIDTPGLRASIMDQNSNKKILSSIKKFMKKCPPDIVLYIDRLDTQTRDFNDLPLLRSISSVLGPSIWLNAIVALTHAASAPPDGPNGTALSYEVFVAQRSHIVQHSIRQAAGDMRLMNPVALVENHPSCRRNREGERVLPNGQNWRPQLLLLCYSSKILSEANSLLKLQDQTAGKLFGFRIRSPPLPFLLSSLLQSRTHPKLSNEMGGESVDSDIDLDDLSDSEQEEGEDEYDQLPPFKPLKKSQIAKLSKEQRKAYFDEYDYRLKLLQKQQWKQELRRLRESKKRGKDVENDFGRGDVDGDNDPENGSPAAVPVPLPDMVLPPSFDCDSPTYRYRFLEPSAQFLARPVLDTHGWDHDCGYDGVSLEQSLAVIGQFPANMSVQITKDKKEFNIHLDSSVSTKHGENGSSMAGFDIQSVGKQLAYFLRGETKFRNYKKNKTTVGASVTFLGENVATGLKIEDQISIGKCVSLVASTGAVRAQGDMAYGANLEARLREKDFPIGQDQSTLGLSLMRWRGDLALGANLQSQFSVGRNSKMALRLGLNNKLSGQITVRTSSSENVQIALVGAIPIAAAILRTIWPSESYIGH
ncbi:hypothetical protein ACLOJK_017875 [Asimina triloba]